MSKSRSLAAKAQRAGGAIAPGDDHGVRVDHVHIVKVPFRDATPFFSLTVAGVASATGWLAAGRPPPTASPSCWSAPPSLSVTVTVTVKVPLVPCDLVGGRVEVSVLGRQGQRLVLPSPQAMTTVCVSSVPGSVNATAQGERGVLGDRGTRRRQTQVARVDVVDRGHDVEPLVPPSL